ncbi:SDR family NAD(P)-dependent oxidoreductase [Promicromonospora thailandica]|uniref:NAD(P)-dependent dehydrogenase, short-chain alcohol dehydrogenase family n=1 Tax=Promicromonospora thailandica TaxID=765201 RepID=A0A9X2JWY7_9MICO|nr:SDR family oxidoreductase [Promicromonospora thailandica]MCP2267120.1 NAD(P)-dependent dehydrogenase, short-chain alcohol dehydrogenase family [Promicromonospora thailandica]BFF16588.1 SDR family oxidoreductase [Promicromonospora thailandica]
MSTRKVVVVTGASQGIGEGLVAAFREIGYAVVATSRTIAREEADDLAVVAGDIADPATADLVVKTAVERFGRVDTLVNNAGVFIAKPFTEYTAEDLDTMVAVNVGGFFHITQRAIPEMLAAGGGHVVNITTTLVESALSVFPSALASVTKGGVASATRALAIEYAERGIRFNAVSPGVIKTPMHPEETHEALAGLHPVGRLGEVDDVARGVVYLEQSPFVTGEFLHIDGGQIAGH